MPFNGKGTLLLHLSGRIAARTYFCALVGIEHAEIDNHSLFEFIVPEDVEAIKQLFDDSTRSTFAPFRLRLKRIDGAEIWTDIQTAAIKTASHEVYAISATVTTMSDREIPTVPNRNVRTKLRRRAHGGLTALGRTRIHRYPY